MGVPQWENRCTTKRAGWTTSIWSMEFSREIIDDEEYLTIENLDALWKAIAMHLVTKQKVLAPKELRFLRERMGLTQAELGARLRVSDQTVARWEKGKGEPGPGDIASPSVVSWRREQAQPEGRKMLEHFVERPMKN